MCRQLFVNVIQVEACVFIIPAENAQNGQVAGPGILMKVGEA